MRSAAYKEVIEAHVDDELSHFLNTIPRDGSRAVSSGELDHLTEPTRILATVPEEHHDD